MARSTRTPSRSKKTSSRSKSTSRSKSRSSRPSPRPTAAPAASASTVSTPEATSSGTIDLVFSFDTTGSMYPCLTQVRQSVQETVQHLFALIPNLRIGIIAHGDYCDGDRAITSLDLTTDEAAICKFVREAPATSGGDADECYELVLNHARSFHWTSGRNKALVLIGDANPHKLGYRYGSKTNDLDWANEASLLVEAGIRVYPVQALGRSGSTSFYSRLAALSSVPKLDLPQFSDIVDIISALCFQQAGQLSQFEETLRTRSVRPSFHVMRTLDQLAGRASDLSARSVTIGSRFQVLEVPYDCSIREFVESRGLTFKKGRGFYQFTKAEDIQDYKDVVAQNKETGAIISGARARQVLNIPVSTARVSPPRNGTHIGFVQSTSVNRKLIAGTSFLYEIDELDGLDA